MSSRLAWASLDCRVNSRTAKATQRNPVSENQKRKKKNKTKLIVGKAKRASVYLLLLWRTGVQFPAPGCGNKS